MFMAIIIWGLLAVTLGGLVVFSSQLEFLVPAVAAVLVLVLSLIPGFEDNILVQTVIWLAASGIGFALLRRKLQSLKMPHGGPVEEAVSGKTAVVIEAIGEDGLGRVKFQGTTWVAKAVDPVAVGKNVTVLGQDGLVLHVEQRNDDRISDEFQALEAKSKESK